VKPRRPRFFRLLMIAPVNETRSRDAAAPELCQQAKPRSQSPENEGRRSAERRTIHGRIDGCGSALSAARSPCGAPPRRLPRRLNASAQPRPRFTRTAHAGVCPHVTGRSRLSEAPRAPVIVPAGTMPGPPGSEGTSLARRNRSHRRRPFLDDSGTL
jgi:hypothetical protein